MFDHHDITSTLNTMFDSLGGNSTLLMFMDIPAEIIRLIIEEAARSSPSAALKFLQLSSVTKGWIEPILYHTVTLRTRNQLISFSLSLDHEGQHNPGTYVRQLSLLLVNVGVRYLEESDLRAVFTKCPNLVHYAFAAPDLLPEPNEEYDIAMFRSVRRISLCSQRSIIRFVPDHFLRLTHLHVISPSHQFYVIFDPNSGRQLEFPDLLSIIIEIIQPSSIHRVAYPADAALAALMSGAPSLHTFLQRATHIQELVLKLQVSTSALTKASLSIEQLMEDPRVRLNHEPFHGLIDEQEATPYSVWQARIRKALNEANDYWQNA